MRIQHNIMAMNAYRNYNTNTSALSKNLEKLSSGYKINRAGDDAAGLAISEKMRAQITGLNTAQKNVKDGISLVKTAEGAMQEVQDMLNRMVDLATQSANGTYDNDVDRAALQAEIDQLNSEIDRIADSANFNGIKLLDGSLDRGGATVKGDFTLPDVNMNRPGSMLGRDTFLHKGGTPQQETVFTVSLDTLQANLKENDELKLELADGSTAMMSLTFKASAAKSYTTKELGDKFKELFDVAGASIGKINKDNFDVEVDANGNLKFTQKAAPTSDSEVVNANLDVKMSYTDAAATPPTPVPLSDSIVTFEANNGTVSGTPGTAITLTGNPATKGHGLVAALATAATTAGTIATSAIKVTIGGQAYEVASTATTASAQNAAWITAFNAAHTGSYVATASGANIKIEAVTAGSSVNAPSGITTWASSGSWAAGSAATGKTMSAANLQNSAIALTADAGSLAAGSITISMNTTTKKLELKVGGTVIASSAEVVNGSKTTFTFSADSANLGSVTFIAAPATADFLASGVAKVLTTGLNYAPASGGSGPTVVDGGTILNSGDGFTIGTSVMDQTLGSIANGSSTTLATVFAGLSEIQMGDATAGGGKDLVIKLDDVAAKFTSSTTLREALQAISDEAKRAVDEWNADPANASKAYHYEYKGLSTDGGSSFLIQPQANGDLDIIIHKVDGAPGGNQPAATVAGVSGNFNAATTVNKQGSTGASGDYASTTFNLKTILDGGKNTLDRAQLTIAGKTYTFKVSDTTDANGQIPSWTIDGDTITLSKDLEGDDLLKAAAEALSNMNHDVFTIGDEASEPGKIVINEKPGNTSYLDKLATKKGFESLLSFKTTTAISTKEGMGMTLQIGDTSESFNQLTVSIGDVHADALGVGGLSVATQKDAQAAIDKIKTAINTVSSIRGTLGATQNRLEHTQNNLSVMAENIQDAESSIRDTDIAEEMMAYTKNNILVQSAQAMLAQANQVPQGVLQLLG